MSNTKSSPLITAIILMFFCNPFASELFAAEYYMATAGSDSNIGTIDAPWATLAYSLTRLSPGDTLYIRGGLYYQYAVSTGLDGTALAPITIQSYPGERAVLDGGVSYYKNAPNSEWELVDANINLYRSVRTFALGFPTAWLMDYDVQIITYDADESNFIESTNYTQLYTTVPPIVPLPFYCGPGMQWRSDGRIYIRLTQNPTELTDVNGDPIAPVPADPNPNNNRIALAFRSGTTPYDHTIIDLVGASYLRFKDLDFVNSSYAMKWYNATHDIELDGCYIEHGYRGLETDDGTTASYNGHIHHCEFNNGMPDWVYWTDVKNGDEGKPAYPEFQSDCIQGQLTGFNIHHNVFRNTMDGIMINSNTDNCKVTDNIFINTRDDAINVYPSSRNTEIARNIMRHCFTGIGLIPGATENPPPKGQIYIHHNVIDVSRLQHEGRPGNYREDRYWFWGTGGIFAKHGDDDLSFWLKFYNNTCIAKRNGRNQAMGPTQAVGNSQKYVYNNIFRAVNDVIPLRDDQQSAGSNYNGNIFWQPAPGAQYMFYNFAIGGYYYHLSALRAAPGVIWEANGLEIDPGFDMNAIALHNYEPNQIWELYRPTNPTIFTAGASYAGLTWPGTTGVDYRGAIPPDYGPDLNHNGGVELERFDNLYRTLA